MVTYVELMEGSKTGVCPECKAGLIAFPGGEHDKPDQPACAKCNWPHFDPPLPRGFEST